VHKFIHETTKNTKSKTKKDENNTKQIKYRRKLNLILPRLYGGELTAQGEGGEEGEEKRYHFNNNNNYYYYYYCYSYCFEHNEIQEKAQRI
jgi:hypothetical protein